VNALRNQTVGTDTYAHTTGEIRGKSERKQSNRFINDLYRW
jgi:hypothetical protein